MSDQFEVIEKAIGPVVEIEERASVWRMPATFSRDYKQIADYLEEQEVDIVDLPYACYLDMDWERELNRGRLSQLFSMLTKKWHFYAGMPTSILVPVRDHLRSRVIPNQHYVKGIHRGPYKDCAVTYRALYEWAKTQKLTLKNEAIECYVNDPREVARADIETVILIPLQIEKEGATVKK